MAQYHDLSDLKKLSHDLKVQAKAAQEAKRVQAAKANRLGAEAAAFREAMASLGVKNEDHTRGRRITTPAKPAPVPHQSKLEKEAVLEESLSDQCDPVVFLESDDGLMFRRQDVPSDIPRKLYRDRKSAVNGRCRITLTCTVSSLTRRATPSRPSSVQR